MMAAARARSMWACMCVGAWHTASRQGTFMNCAFRLRTPLECELALPHLGLRARRHQQVRYLAASGAVALALCAQHMHLFW